MAGTIGGMAGCRLGGAFFVLLACGPRIAQQDDGGGTAEIDSSSSSSSSGRPGVGVSDGSAASTGTGSESGEPAPVCLPSVEAGTFTSVAEAAMGRMRVFDLDADGALDLVGARGRYVLLGGPTPVVRTLTDGTGEMLAGEFGGDGAPDLLHATAEGELRVYVGPSLEAAPYVATPMASSSSYAAHDVDADGIDDLALVPAGSETLEVWHGHVDGTFALGTTIATGAQPRTAHLLRLEGSYADLVVHLGNEGRLAVYAGDGAGGFAAIYDESEPFAQVRGVTIAPDAPDQDAVVLSWGGGQLAFPRDDSGVVAWSAGQWRAWRGEDDGGGVAYDIAAGDVNQDGTTDLMFPIDYGDGKSLRFVCTSSEPGPTQRCGDFDVDHEPREVAILSDGPLVRVVYTTETDGTWIAPLQTIPCP